MQANGRASPNPAVGCVIVKDGQIVAEGATEEWGGLHAETKALQIAKSAGREVRGATAYVTLEPCCHHGRQPPCTDALIRAGIARCVVGVRDPYREVAGRGIRQLEAHKIEVTVNVLRNECVAWNMPFIFHCLHYKPLIAAKWAQSLNGALADEYGGSQWISGASAREYTHLLRAHYDAIMVGAGTVLSDFPRLTARGPHAARQPVRVIYDPFAKLATLGPKETKKLGETTFNAEQKVLWLTTIRQPDLKQHIFQVILEKDEPLAESLARLSSEEVKSFLGRDLQSVFVEGGPRLIQSLGAEDLIDCFHVFIHPMFVPSTRHTVNNMGRATKLAELNRYKLVASHRFDNDQLMEFIPERVDRAMFAKESV
jgi:diaminohydroxyphosphoribosylaminopyrimidine deaminase/5-amino-6-(5-phosphoribosylamino)uracil reductase